MNQATVFIKQAIDGKYFWELCLSANDKLPSCKSPSDYIELRECRQSAMRFAKHLTSKIRIADCDEILVEDTVGDRRKLKAEDKC